MIRKIKYNKQKTREEKSIVQSVGYPKDATFQENGIFQSKTQQTYAFKH